MFAYAYAFKDIGGWDVSSVTTMYRMFYEASAFNQDIGGWDVSSVTDMRELFTGAAAFNQNLCAWKDDILVNNPLPTTTDMFTNSGCGTDPGPSSTNVCQSCN